MTFQAVLFDLDGTLLDTIDDLTDAMNTALAEMGFPRRTAAECKNFVGDGVENFAARALPENQRDKQSVAKLIALYHDQYIENWAAKTRPYQGIEELLDALAARGLAMTIFSNKPHEFTTIMAAKLLPKWDFKAVIGARAGRPKKPDPTVAIEIAGQLNLPPDQFIYLGDTNTDMQTATAAGMYPAGALWGFRKADELLANGAKVLLEYPMDLLKML